jgi:hypothetical protein
LISNPETQAILDVITSKNTKIVNFGEAMLKKGANGQPLPIEAEIVKKVAERRFLKFFSKLFDSGIFKNGLVGQIVNTIGTYSAVEAIKKAPQAVNFISRQLLKNGNQKTLDPAQVALVTEVVRYIQNTNLAQGLELLNLIIDLSPSLALAKKVVVATTTTGVVVTVGYHSIAFASTKYAEYQAYRFSMNQLQKVIAARIEKFLFDGSLKTTSPAYFEIIRELSSLKTIKELENYIIKLNTLGY